MWVEQLSLVLFSFSDSRTLITSIYQLCHLRIVCFQWWEGEGKGLFRGCIPTLNCLKLEPTHHFLSHSCWRELSHKVSNDLQRRLENTGKHMDLWPVLLCHRLLQQRWPFLLPGTIRVVALESLASQEKPQSWQTEKLSCSISGPYLVHSHHIYMFLLYLDLDHDFLRVETRSHGSFSCPQGQKHCLY